MDSGILLLLLLLFLALPIWQIVKQNKQVRNIREMQSRLVPGAEVITSSGQHGIVVATTETTVDLVVADGVVTRWEKAAIARNLTEGTGAELPHRGAEEVRDEETGGNSADNQSEPNRVSPTDEAPNSDGQQRRNDGPSTS